MPFAFPSSETRFSEELGPFSSLKKLSRVENTASACFLVHIVYTPDQFLVQKVRKDGGLFLYWFHVELTSRSRAKRSYVRDILNDVIFQKPFKLQRTPALSPSINKHEREIQNFCCVFERILLEYLNVMNLNARSRMTATLWNSVLINYSAFTGAIV